MKKKVLSMIVVLVFCFSSMFAMTGCGSAKPTAGGQTEKLRMVLVSPLVSNPIFARIKLGFDRAGQEFNFETSMVGPDDVSFDKMIEAMETSIAEKVDGIVMYPVSPSAFTPVLEKAKEANISVGCFFSDAEKKDHRVAFVGTDSKKAGYDQAQEIYKKIKTPLKLGIIMSALDTQDELNQVEGVKEFLKTVPGSEILTMVKDDGDQIKAADALTELIKSYPQMNSVISTEGAGAPAFGKVLQEMDMIDKITLIAMDDIDQNLQTVRDGLIYGIMAQDFDSMGYLNGKYIAAAIRGETFTEITLSPAKFVSKDNIDTYNSK